MTDVICDYDFCKHYEDGRCGLDAIEICGGHCQDLAMNRRMMMKTSVDLYEDVGIPCYYCKHAFTPLCIDRCIDSTLYYMCEIAEDMILKGEY